MTQTEISRPEDDAHSSLVGGSIAAARIACPASWQMEQKLPKAAKTSSTYADEGSALHAAIAHALNNDLPAQSLLGMAFPPYEDYPITQDMIDEALVPCLRYFDELDAECVGLEFYVEKRVAIPAIPGAFGTADVIGKSAYYSVVGDWKFGVGEKVEVWDEPLGELGFNAQLMFYALAATLTCPEMFNLNDPEWEIELFIGQPRHRDGPNFDCVTVRVRELNAFKHRLMQAVVRAKSDKPPMAKGKHCRFMPCKAICPLHTGPLLIIPDFASDLLAKRLEVSTGLVTDAEVDWGNTYRLMLDIAEQVEPLLREWRAQAQAYLEDGGSIPRWKMVEKRASRRWTKPDKSVERRLARLGLSKDERMPRELLSPPQAEKLLKARGKALPEGYFDAISSGNTLAPDSDKRHSVEPVGAAMAALATALESLIGPREN